MNYLPLNLANVGLVSDNARLHLRKTKSEELSPCASLSSMPSLRRFDSFDIIRSVGTLLVDDDDDDCSGDGTGTGTKDSRRLPKSPRTSESNNTSRWDNITTEAPKPPPGRRSRGGDRKIRPARQPDQRDVSPKRPSRLVREESRRFSESPHKKPARQLSWDGPPSRPSRLLREESKKYFKSSLKCDASKLRSRLLREESVRYLDCNKYIDNGDNGDSDCTPKMKSSCGVLEEDSCRWKNSPASVAA
jgi:hypothetical protein